MAEYSTSSSSSPPQPLPLHQTPPIVQPKSQPLQSQLQQQMLQLQQNMVQLRQQTLQKQQEMARLSHQLNGSSKIINTNTSVSSFQSNPSTSRVQLQQQIEQFRVQYRKQQYELHRLRCQIRMMALQRVHATANCGGSSTQVSINQLGGKRKIEDLLSQLDLNEKAADLIVGDLPPETAENSIHLEGAVSVQNYKFHPGASPVQSIRGMEIVRSHNLSSQVTPKKPLASYTKPIRMTAPPQQLISWQMIAAQVGTIARTSLMNAGLMQNATTGQKRLKQMLPPISSSSCSSCLLQHQHLQNLQKQYMQLQSGLLLIRHQLAYFLRMNAVNLRGSQPDAAAATAASPTITPTFSSCLLQPQQLQNLQMLNMQLQSRLFLIQQQLLGMKAVNLRGSQPHAAAATATSPTITPTCSSCLLQPQHLQNLQMHYMQLQSRLLLIQQQLASLSGMKAVNLRGSQPHAAAAAAATAASPTITPTASSIVGLPVSGSNGRMDCDVEDLADDFVDVVRLTDSQIPASNPSSSLSPLPLVHKGPLAKEGNGNELIS